MIRSREQLPEISLVFMQWLVIGHRLKLKLRVLSRFSGKSRNLMNTAGRY